MKTLKEKLLAGMRPSEALRELAEQHGGLSSADLVKVIDDEFDGIPATVIHAIANWNKGEHPDRKGWGLNDEQFDAVVTNALNAFL
jgi:hypothetical protein